MALAEAAAALLTGEQRRLDLGAQLRASEKRVSELQVRHQAGAANFDCSACCSSGAAAAGAGCAPPRSVPPSLR